MLRRHRLALAVLLSAAAVCPAGAIPVERIASGLAAPIYVAAPPDDDRLFIVQRGGTILIRQNNQLLPTPFLNITDRVDTQGEGGLLGLAFPPDYASSRAFYVYYTADGSPLTSRISRFRANASNPNVADDAVAQEKILLSQPQPQENHNGGTVTFGPDGKLYMAFGDGGGQGDPNERAQDPTSLLGKMIRIDVAFENFDDDYAVPNDNPFDPPYQPEIWAVGFRNPFRFSFDRETGDLYIGDVGGIQREEVDVEPAGDPGGRNYGWDVMEGTTCHQAPDAGEPPCNDPSLTLPVYEYDHSEGLAITGGVVYRGSAVPELVGQYVFSDSSSSRLWTLVWDGDDGVVGDVLDRTADFVPDQGAIGSVVALGEDADGELYIVDLGGEVFRVPEPAQALLALVGAGILAGVRRFGRRREVARAR